MPFLRFLRYQCKTLKFRQNVFSEVTEFQTIYEFYMNFSFVIDFDLHFLLAWATL